MPKAKFEDKLKRLEEIAEMLDGSDISLEEMLKIYEEGTVLVKDCREFLEKAEQRIIDITKSESE
jgi:exodeoxyribonuclease VII small subunit